MDGYPRYNHNNHELLQPYPSYWENPNESEDMRYLEEMFVQKTYQKFESKEEEGGYIDTYDDTPNFIKIRKENDVVSHKENLFRNWLKKFQQHSNRTRRE